MHPCEGLFVIVYTDDVKLAGPASAAKMWKRIAEVVAMSRRRERVLGRMQRSFESFIDRSARIGTNLPGIPKATKPSEQNTQRVNVMEYDDMSSFIGQCLGAYESLPGGVGGFLPYRSTQTPFLPEEPLPGLRWRVCGRLGIDRP